MMNQPNSMTPEYQAALQSVTVCGCRACHAHDSVPSLAAEGKIDIYCELLQTPGQPLTPVVIGVEAGSNTPLPDCCPYFKREGK